MDKPTLITNATVINVEAGIACRGTSILIRQGRIESVSSQPPEVDAEEMNAQGAYISPGLIDAHVHLFLDAGPDPLGTFLRSSEDSRMANASRNAELAIKAGVTTVRDCGGPADLIFRLRDAMHRADIVGPRILAAGSPFMRPKGHCHFFGIEVTEPLEIRSAIERQVRQGAAFVKLMASGGGLTPGTRPSEADLPVEIMREAVITAHAHGIHVSAHCHATESIVRALDTGVDIIEHASFVPPEGPPRFDRDIAARIRDQGVVVSPTVISGVRIARTLRKAAPRTGEMSEEIVRLESRKLHVAHFCESGVRIIAGSDCGVANTSFDSIADELAEYVTAGMSAAAALRSATSNSARYLGQPLLGRIESGCAADLLFLNGNPLDHICHLRNPMLVMKGGKVACDFRRMHSNALVSGD